MNLTHNAKFVAARQQVSCDVAGEAVILDMQKGTYFGLNVVGASIWNQLREPKSLPELCRAIVMVYDVDAARCESDIKALLEQLLEHGLIEACNH